MFLHEISQDRVVRKINEHYPNMEDTDVIRLFDLVMDILETCGVEIVEDE